MKKRLVILLCAAMILSMLGCQSSEPAPTAAEVPEGAITAPVETEAAVEETAAPTEPPKPWANNVLADHSYAAPDYLWEELTVPGYPELNPEKSGITSITFLDTLADMPAGARDASQAKDGSVMSWLDGTDLYIAGEGGVMAPKNSTFLLGCYVDLTALNLNGCFHTEQAETMNSMFIGLEKLETLDLSSLDTSNVTDMAMMFLECRGLKVLDVSHFNTANVTDMSYMFANLKGLTSLDVSSFDTSNVEDMHGMFSELTMEALDLRNFDTSNVEDMHGMFVGCRQMKTLDVNHFNTENVSDMEMLFRSCESITSLDVSCWDTSLVENMSGMFEECYSLTDLNLGEWEVDSVGEYQGFLDRKFKINGEPWENLFASVAERESNLPKVAASNVIPEPGIPEGGYQLTVHRNVPLKAAARKEAKKTPQLESILIDDIPIILIAGEASDSMPVYIEIHPAGGSKEDNLGWLAYVANRTGGYAIALDCGGYGESQRGTMTDAESICMAVTDIDKILAFCSTLPGADLGRIAIHGNSMGGVAANCYLARGSFTPLFVSILSTSFGKLDPNLDPSGPVFRSHGSNKRDIPALSGAAVKELLLSYSLEDPQRVADTFLAFGAGSRDAGENKDAFEEELKKMGKEDYAFYWFDAGHDIPVEAYDLVREPMFEILQEGKRVENTIPTVTITVASE